MRVVHVIPSIDPKAGGPTALLLGLTAAQAKMGMQVSVLTSFRNVAERSMETRFNEKGVDVELLGPVNGKLGRHPDLRFHVNEWLRPAHIVHIHGVWEQLLHDAAVTARSRKISYVISPHGMLDPWSLRQSRWVKKVMLAWRIRRNLQRAAALHFTSAAECELTSLMRLRNQKIVEPLGIDLQEFEHLPPRGTLRHRFPQIGDRPLLVFLGRIHPGKGLEHLIPAMAVPGVPEAALVVIGPDSENFRETIERLIAEHKLQNRVFFTGLLSGPDRIAALVDADLFCLPSDHENFGVAIVEALAAGVPALISNEVAIWKELVDAGVAAATPPDAKLFAAELQRWLGDPMLRSSAAEKARPFVQSRYDWNQIAERWRGHYEKILTR